MRQAKDNKAAVFIYGTRKITSLPNKRLILRVCSTSAFENTVGKGDMYCSSPFPKVFSDLESTLS